MLEFVINPLFSAEVGRASQAWLFKRASGALTTARANCPIGHPKIPFTDRYGRHGGALRASLEIFWDESEDAMYIGSALPYAAAIEFGTGPYVISNGFGRGITINHPGIPATPFLRNAVHRKLEF